MLCFVQLSSRLLDSEKKVADKLSELETKLIQSTKDAELLKVFVLCLRHMTVDTC